MQSSKVSILVEFVLIAFCKPCSVTPSCSAKFRNVIPLCQQVSDNMQIGHCCKFLCYYMNYLYGLCKLLVYICTVGLQK